MTGLEDKYEQFSLLTDDIFSDLVKALPVCSNSKLLANKCCPKSEKSVFDSTFDYHTAQSGEGALVSFMIKLIRKLRDIVKDKADSNPLLKEIIAASPQYIVKDHQKMKIPLSLHKPDLAFYFGDDFSMGFSTVGLILEAKIEPTLQQIPDDTLGQLADYGNALWMAQPTRTFAPVFYIHGPYLTLVLFYRDGWYKVELGSICFTEHIFDDDTILIISKCLQRFMFLVNLPLELFGHFCSVTKHIKKLFFAPALLSGMSSTADCPVLRTASTKVIPNSSCIEITSPIALPISIRGRAAYLYNVLFNGRKAVLKMAWSPINQVPEGAVYDLLCKHNTRHIPKVFDRGLLLENLNGYRLEYLIIENCGQNIDDYLQQLPIDKDHGSFVRPLVNQVMECLVSARSIGILHRDISSGNIAVRN
ncbi:hypothetical protein J3B02_004162, partial [Coemansia erecta]